MTCSFSGCSGLSFQDSVPMYEENLKKVGQTVHYIMGERPFFYTVGAAATGIPDVFLSAPLSPEVGLSLVNDTCHKLRQQKGWFGIYDDILKGSYDALVLPCNHNMDEFLSDYVFRNEAFFERTSHTRKLKNGAAYYAQLVLPDVNHKYPYDHGYSEGFTQQLFSTTTYQDFLGDSVVPFTKTAS